MTFTTVSKAMKSTLVLGLALFATSAFAAANKQTLQITHPTMVNGTTLKAGEYKLEWEGTGPNVELSIKQGKNVVAKVPARVVELPENAINSAAVTTKNGDGNSALAGARFEGKKFALEIGDSGSDMSTAGSSK
jgi:hypothetical protein